MNSRPKQSCTVLILTYKGKNHLELLLPTVVEAIQKTPDYHVDVQIVDNGCDAETKLFVETHFPRFRFEFSEKNDYLFSLNPVVGRISSPYVVILNDDMKLEANVLNQILPLIEANPSLFSVGCNVLNWEGTDTTVGVRILQQSNGWMHSKFVEMPDQSIRYTLYGGGGAAVFRTEMFNSLGGFNSLYRPAYGEDADLGYRAWKRGWKSILHPDALLYHRDGATIREQFTSDDLQQKMYKNHLLFMLRNCQSWGFILWFFLLLPQRLIRWKKSNQNLFNAWNMARPRMIKALLQRRADQPRVLGDRQIISTLNTLYAFEK